MAQQQTNILGRHRSSQSIRTTNTRFYPSDLATTRDRSLLEAARATNKRAPDSCSHFAVLTGEWDRGEPFSSFLREELLGVGEGRTLLSSFLIMYSKQAGKIFNRLLAS
jgi:hypothetical protein